MMFRWRVMGIPGCWGVAEVSRLIEPDIEPMEESVPMGEISRPLAWVELDPSKENSPGGTIGRGARRREFVDAPEFVLFVGFGGGRNPFTDPLSEFKSSFVLFDSNDDPRELCCVGTFVDGPTSKPVYAFPPVTFH